MSNQKSSDGFSKEKLDMMSLVAEAVNRSPYYSHIRMKVVGFTDEGHSKLEMEVSKEHMNIWNTAHGGALASILDSACGVATVPLREGNENTVTMDMHIKYFAPVREGKVTAYGKVAHKGKGTVATEAEAYDEEGNLLGKAYTTHRVKLPKKK